MYVPFVEFSLTQIKLDKDPTYITVFPVTLINPGSEPEWTCHGDVGRQLLKTPDTTITVLQTGPLSVPVGLGGTIDM